MMAARVYRATMQEMNDFVELTAKASDMAIQCGAVRIDPPAEWKPPPSRMLSTSRFFVRRQMLPEAPFVHAHFLTHAKSELVAQSQPTPKQPRCKAHPESFSHPQQPPSAANTTDASSHPAKLPANSPSQPSTLSSSPTTAQPSPPAYDSVNPSDHTVGSFAPVPQPQPIPAKATSTAPATQTLQGSSDAVEKATAVEHNEEESEVEVTIPSVKRSTANRKRKANQLNPRAYHQDSSGKLSKPITFSYSETPISLKEFKRRTRAALRHMYAMLCADEELQMRVSDEGEEWYKDIDRAQDVFWHALKKGIAGKPLNVDYGVDVEVEGAFDSKEMSYTEWYGNSKQTKSLNVRRKSSKRDHVKSKRDVTTNDNSVRQKEPSGSRYVKGQDASQGATSKKCEEPKRDIRNFNQETLLRLLPQMPGINRSMYYVGQLFTRFCWHTEDAFLNSISYLHEGSAEKVWYAVPPENAPDFERYASEHVFSPSLIHDDTCGQQLLMNKTTMFDPRDLMKHGVPVYRVVHKPRSFVVTAPRAYHAGFNCGLNIAEAVNFANPTWFPHGRGAMSFARRVFRPLCIPWEYLLYHEARQLVEKVIPLHANGCLPSRVRRHAGIVAKELERIIREGEEQIRAYAEREGVELRMFSSCRKLVEHVSIGLAYGYNAGVSCSLCGHASHFYAEVCGSCEVSEEARCTKHFGVDAPVCDREGHCPIIMRRHDPVTLIDILGELERVAGIETSETDELKRYKLFLRPWKSPARRSGLILRMNLAAALSRSRITEAKF
ncbi:hypothetical protein BWQ96_04654 [Gracilariopsis chorda]|uniref:JmjC domain-containing protein n=1 Tax=Gracilariopsis chorda TaxID=448386 RepID=A0A2V3IV46_9FLOR|nr:hypothetical protein BWQ96_04654 [Gracilariopsis chorda]|eukprot:PXF45577.1 hypothetical protein BWQ96_04654 [Gracilariopsis chorda]